MKSLLSEKEGINIVAEADDGDQALEMPLNHRAHIMRKTRAQGQVGLTKYAARIGLIDLDLWD